MKGPLPTRTHLVLTEKFKCDVRRILINRRTGNESIIMYKSELANLHIEALEFAY